MSIKRKSWSPLTENDSDTLWNGEEIIHVSIHFLIGPLSQKPSDKSRQAKASLMTIRLCWESFVYSERQRSSCLSIQSESESSGCVFLRADLHFLRPRGIWLKRFKPGTQLEALHWLLGLHWIIHRMDVSECVILYCSSSCCVHSSAVKTVER